MILTELWSWPEASHDFLTKQQNKKEYYPFHLKVKFLLRIGLIVLLQGGGMSILGSIT